MPAIANLQNVAISDIRTNPVALREVNTEKEDYQNLVADVGRRGILNAITVVAKTDEALGESYYQIVDGLHRYSAAVENGMELVPVNILDIEDADLIETQIVANLVKVDTSPVDYTKALQRLMSANPTMTVNDLAERISQSPTFVLQRFSLLKLDPPIQALVNDGSIKLGNAYALAKLPAAHQHEWSDAAMVQPPSEFVPAVNARVKELREAARAGKGAGEAKFEASPRLRKLSELKPELENGSVGSALTLSENVTTAAEGFALALKWVLHMDTASLASAEAAWNQQRKAREEAAKKRKAVAAKKKQDEAVKKAEAAVAASGMTEEEIEAALAKEVV